MMPKTAIISSLVLSLLVAGGCSRWTHRAPKSYTTVVTDGTHDTDQARKECERAAELFEKGHIVKAEMALQDALIADVSYAPAHNNLGRIYFDQGNLYLAAWEFEYARRLLPDSSDVVNNLGMVYEAAGETDQAIEHYTMALSLDGGNPVYAGNLARALLREDKDPQQTALLLQNLALNDTRPTGPSGLETSCTCATVSEPPRTHNRRPIRACPPPKRSNLFRSPTSPANPRPSAFRSHRCWKRCPTYLGGEWYAKVYVPGRPAKQVPLCH